jgi:hypothetical protein
MLRGNRSKTVNSMAMGIVLSSTTLWAGAASAQSLFDIIKMPLNMIQDRIPTQLPNVNSRTFDSNLNGNTVNFCMFPCSGGNLPAGIPIAAPQVAPRVAPQVIPQSVPVAPSGVSSSGVSVSGGNVSTPGVSVSPNNVSAPAAAPSSGISASGVSATPNGVSVSPNNVSAPAAAPSSSISASDGNVSAPGVSATPNGVSVAPSAIPQVSQPNSSPAVAIPPIQLPLELPNLF